MFQTKNEYKIMKLLLSNPNMVFYLREIARLTKISPSNVFGILNKLEKENLIKRNKNKATTNFQFKFNEKNKGLKRMFNINEIIKSKIIEFLTEGYNHPEAIILFGSYSLGEDTEKGDIDIAVITKKHKILELFKFEKYLNRKIHLLEIDLTKISKEFKNSLANGFVLEGYLNLE